MKAALEILRDFIRPLSVMALLFVLLLGAVVAGVLEAVLPGIGVQFTVGIAGWFRAVPDAYYQLTGAALLGYTAARTTERAVRDRSRGRHGARPSHRRYAAADSDGQAGSVRPDDPDGD